MALQSYDRKTRIARPGLNLFRLEDRLTPAYSATLSATTSTWTGGSSGGTGDILLFSANNGFLIHNRFVAGDPGFTSASDFDSKTAGEQKLAAVNTSTVLITGGKSSLDEIRIGGSVGGLVAAASQLLASFTVTAGTAGQAVLVDDSSATTGRTFTFASNGVTATGVSISFAGPAFGDGILLSTGTGNDTVNLTSVLGIANGIEPRNVTNDGGNDTVTIGSAAGSLDGFAGQPIRVQGNDGTTSVVVNDSGDADGDGYIIGPTGLHRGSGLTEVEVGHGGVGVRVSLNTGGGDDSILFALGGSLNGGTIDAGTGVDTLSYQFFNAPVAVNLGLGVSGLSASLDGGQENPANGQPGTGTATFTNYNVVTKTFDIAVTVTDLNPALVTGFHIHRAGVGVNGPIILPLDTLFGLGSLVPSGTGFTFNATGVSLVNSLLGGAANEAAFLGGQTYLNFHTAAFPGGEIRGQIFSTGNVNVATGTATGTGGVTGVEFAAGGSANDSLVGSFAANTLSGAGGNDTLLGGPGADTFLGGANDDTMVWANGDGSDVMDGEAGADIVTVNGNVTADEVFTVGANGTRLDFDRVSPGPFSLDIGTAETLVVNGVGGKETFTVNDLTGVADVTAIQFNGLAGEDTFAVAAVPAGITVTVRGGVGNDTVTVGGPSMDSILGSVVVDGGGNDADPTTTQTGSNGANTLPTGDTLILEDGGDDTINNYNFSISDLIRNGLTVVRHNRTETLRLNAGTGGDTFTVDARAGANTFVSAGGGDDTLTLNVGNGANARLDGDAGADTFTISGSGTGSVALLNGGADNDTFEIIVQGGSIDNIAGGVVVDGGDHAASPTSDLTAGGVTNTRPVGDTLRFNDDGDASANTYALSSTALTRTGVPDFSFATVESVVLNAGTGKNTITIAPTSPSTTTTVNGGPDTDSLAVVSTGAASNTVVNGGGGADAFTVTNTGPNSVTIVNGDGAADTLSVPTAGSTNPNLTTTSDATGVRGAFTFGDRGPVGFATVEAVNPLITSVAAATFTQTISGSFNVVAAGAPTVTFTVTGGTLPGGVTIAPNGVLSGTPTESGTFPITITASNGTAPDSAQTFTLTVNGPPNSPPTISDTGHQSGIGLIGPFTVTVGDAESPVELLSVTGASSFATLFPAGSVFVSGTGATRQVLLLPAAGQTGSATITITVTDPDGLTATDTFTATVQPPPPPPNVPPQISDVGDVTVPFGGFSSVVPFFVSDSDASTTSLTVTATSDNPALLANAGVVLAGTGTNRTFVVTPNAGQSGTATITLTVADGRGGTATDTFAVAVAAPAPLPAPPSGVTVFESAGANAAGIQASVDAFRAAIGGGTTPGAAGSFGGIRREINWDAVPATKLNPFPGDFFNVNSKRGVLLSTGGTGLAVSGDAGTAQFEFSDVTAQQWGPIEFSSFSSPKLFAPLGSNTYDVEFRVAGTQIPAGVNSFGVVFTDVDLANVTKLEFFDASGILILSRDVLPTGVKNEGLSFLGVTLPTGVLAAKVRVTTGTHPIDTPFAFPPPDGVAVDDFIFSEPEALPAEVKTDLFAVGTGPGVEAQVNVFNNDASFRFALFPFPGFSGGVNVTTGDVTGDGFEDIAVGAGPGGGPHVKVFDGLTGEELRSFFAYDESFRGGVFVGLGDVTGDLRADLVTGAGVGGGPHVKVLDGQTLAELHSFFAYDPDFRGGVTVRLGDVSGDGFADVVTGAGPGGGPHVRVFDGRTRAEIQNFFAGDPESRGGVFVGVADFRNTGNFIVTASANGRVFAPGYIEQESAIPVPTSSGNTRVPVAAIRLDTGIIAILIGAVPGTRPTVKLFDGTTNTLLREFAPFGEAFTGGVFVG
jgi:fibronectin-binding autotransporter adhesin